MWNRLLGVTGSGRPEPLRAGLFGKLPLQPDFVQFGQVDDAVREFRDYLDAAVSWGTLRRAEAQEAFRQPAGRVYAFAYRPRTAARSLIVGVTKPSHDAVGRAFPLTIYAAIPSEPVERRPELLPLALGDFLEHGWQILLGPDPVGQIAALDGSLSRGELSPLGELDAREREYAAWAESTALASVVAALCGAGGAYAALVAIGTIREAIAPFRAQERPVTPLSVRLPLGTGGVGAAAFWLDVVRRSASFQRTVPTAFWSADANGGDALIQLGETPESSLSELWAPDPASDHTCNLVTPNSGNPEAFLNRLPESIRGLFQRPDARVVDLLAALAE